MIELITHNSTFEQHGLWIATAICWLAIGWFGWTTLTILFGRRSGLELHPFEAQRRGALRAGSSLYRWTEPLIDEVELFANRRNKDKLDRLARGLAQSAEQLPWRPTDFFATKSVEGGLVSLAVFGFVLLIQPLDKAIMATIITLFAYGFLAENSVLQKAMERGRAIKKRLPYAVDLIALMMQAGGGFQESLATFVDESKGHPLAEEMQVVLDQIELGRPQHEALEALNDRVKDDDVSELVFAINKGEELGTPIVSILREQAEQMRMKRSQWGEKAAAEAGVKVIFPGMFIVIACLLVVLTPFALPILDALK